MRKEKVNQLRFSNFGDSDKLSIEAQTSDTSSPSRDKLVVTVSFGDARAEFSGSPEVVLTSVTAFISKQIPEMDLARKVSLNFDTKEVIERFQDFVRITPEGPRVLSPERKLSDKEAIALQLVAQKIAAETREGLSPFLTLGALQELTSMNPKSLSSRLSEMIKAGLVTKDSTGDEKKPSFKINTIGIQWLSSVLAKRA